ncbi:hypothetical protein DFH27DRAFT_524942 [Peziza echinospora]|nr:hypothetical protein DFH27DRAFT_524942 [Peziza echinospora]
MSDCAGASRNGGNPSSLSSLSSSSSSKNHGNKTDRRPPLKNLSVRGIFGPEGIITTTANTDVKPSISKAASSSSSSRLKSRSLTSSSHNSRAGSMSMSRAPSRGNSTSTNTHTNSQLASQKPTTTTTTPNTKAKTTHIHTLPALATLTPTERAQIADALYPPTLALAIDLGATPESGFVLGFGDIDPGHDDPDYTPSPCELRKLKAQQQRLQAAMDAEQRYLISLLDKRFRSHKVLGGTRELLRKVRPGGAALGGGVNGNGNGAGNGNTLLSRLAAAPRRLIGRAVSRRNSKSMPNPTTDGRALEDAEQVQVQVPSLTLPSPSPLCPRHRPLCHRLIHTLLTLLQRELGPSLTTLFKLTTRPGRNLPPCTADIRGKYLFLDSLVHDLLKLNSFWMPPDKYARVFQRAPPPECGYVRSGCEGCMLAGVVASEDALVGLRTAVRLRQRVEGGGYRAGSGVRRVNAYSDDVNPTTDADEEILKWIGLWMERAVRYKCRCGECGGYGGGNGGKVVHRNPRELHSWSEINVHDVRKVWRREKRRMRREARGEKKKARGHRWQDRSLAGGGDGEIELSSRWRGERSPRPEKGDGDVHHHHHHHHHEGRHDKHAIPATTTTTRQESTSSPSSPHRPARCNCLTHDKPSGTRDTALRLRDTHPTKPYPTTPTGPPTTDNESLSDTLYEHYPTSSSASSSRSPSPSPSPSPYPDNPRILTKPSPSPSPTSPSISPSSSLSSLSASLTHPEPHTPTPTTPYPFPKLNLSLSLWPSPPSRGSSPGSPSSCTTCRARAHSGIPFEELDFLSVTEFDVGPEDLTYSYPYNCLDASYDDMGYEEDEEEEEDENGAGEDDDVDMTENLRVLRDVQVRALREAFTGEEMRRLERRNEERRRGERGVWRG